MIYLLSQILICLALAALLGGAGGWLLRRSRDAAREDELLDALELRERQLERAQTDVAMLTDDFDDLRERSRVEIDALREETRQLPALVDNLEKSQLLVRQMIQRHEIQARELTTANAALEQRVARLQEQTGAYERALAAAAAESALAEASLAEAPSEASRAPDGDAAESRAAPGEDGMAVDGAAALAGGGADSETAVPPDASGTARPAPSATRRGWASRTLGGGAAGGEAPDELLDEVMEVDDDLAAELREGIEPGRRAPALDAESGSAEPAAPRDGASGSSAAWHEDDATLRDDDYREYDEDEDDYDEDANATLAIEVFSMDDVHDSDALPREDVADEAPRHAESLFRPVDRQDDLQRIFGIGPVTEKALNELGITSYPQLAELDRPEIEKIARALDIVPETIERDDWVGNARRQLEDVLEEL